jgi:pSer/pThr/pTyr-binding forkhead associated (FHA) protein
MLANNGLHVEESRRPQVVQPNDILVLRAAEGQLLNNVYIIGDNGAALGRHSASNDMVISESFVSRRHCEIKFIAQPNTNP